MGSENQSALDEALREHEKYAMEYHSTTHLGGYDACARCGPDRQLRDDAAAELARMRLLVRDVCEDLHGDVCEATCDSYGHAEKCRVVSALEEVRALIAENARMRERISDLVLLWSWGAGGKAGTGFAEKLGGDGDGETWAVKFDPMDPDEGCEFVVRVETGQDGLPILDDAARAALGGRDE